MLLLVIGCKGRVHAKPESARVYDFFPAHIIDRQITGLEAFSVLVPKGWKYEGGIVWRLHPTAPAAPALRIWDPGGVAEFAVFPVLSFVASSDPNAYLQYPFGSNYLGNEVRPTPSGPIEALKTIVLPRYFSNIANYRVVREELLPALAQATRAENPDEPGITTTVSAAKIGIEYEQNGVPVEQEIYCSIVQKTFYTLTSWTIDKVFSFKAAKGKLIEESPRFLTMTYSMRLSLPFFNKLYQLIQALVHYKLQDIANQGVISRIISQTNDEISAERRQAYENTRRADERTTESFGDAMLGLENYYDPIREETVKLPIGGVQAWTNNLGEYRIGLDQDYNPNIGDNVNWQRMDRK